MNNVTPMVGISAACRAIEAEIVCAANTDAKVLITGESGVGKEVVAKLIHHRSRRARSPLVTINCAGIPDTLLASELFGHVRGSFTDAYRDKEGWLEQANGGTIFMDEIGEMSTQMQSLLLRFLENGEIQRVGSERRTTSVDVRVITATNRRLLERVATGEFREDLFYRLNVIPVELPPLRERKEDIPLLVQHFLDKFRAADTSAGQSRPALTVAQDAIRHLMAYSWPGNVRQLENAIERAVAINAGRPQIDVADLPVEIQQAEPALPSTVSLPEGGLDLDAFIAHIERELIERSLERTGGNKGRAAKLLNLKRTTLVEKLKRLGKQSIM